MLDMVVLCPVFFPSNSQTYSLSSTVTLVPPYSGRRTLSPSFTPIGMTLPSVARAPGPTATTVPSLIWLVGSKDNSREKKKKKKEERGGNQN